MKMYRNPASIKAFADHAHGYDLQRLVQNRLKSLLQPDLDYAALLLAVMVVEEGDTTDDLENAVGFSVVCNRWNSLPPGSEHFTPSWDALDEHADWFELTFILSDEGEGIVVFIPKAIACPLGDLCRAFATDQKGKSES
ncbi:hypothetical protein [Acidovorax sp. FG27]|uniref:hypothetical protein n=1 Tax=Acidovorax sp. FG27 TaxID=3133652 RepID=UPI0030E9521B